jgi:UDP-N-acetylmuramate--alanine ligase
VFSGIGGSGMLPLALILKAKGFEVAGSDRSYDQGRTPGKFSFLQTQGITLFPQDGSAVSGANDILVVSTAVEETVPDVVAARARNITVMRRAELLAELFNQAKVRIAIAGTSGKTTVTGMTGYLLKETGRDPTVMNGGIFRNYADENPYATALTGQGDVFVTEADESDGSIALYAPTIAVLNNIALDHKPMDELVPLFEGYLAKADICVVNFDSPEVMALAGGLKNKKIISYGFGEGADLRASDVVLRQEGLSASINGMTLTLNVPGRHNLANALAAMGAAMAAGVDLKTACATLEGFTGIKRRMEVVGTAGGITVMDDFAHNPDKIAASLKALREFPGRLIVFFQPHGYGFLKLLKTELADCFSQGLGKEDRLLVVEPFYAGGTVDRSVQMKDIVPQISGPHADLYEDRDAVKAAIVGEAHSGDRIIIMGARDDTLSDFARDILKDLRSGNTDRSSVI